MSTRCPACHSTSLRPLRAEAGLFLRCRDCATLFDTDPLSPAEVRALYQGRAYYVKDDDELGNGADGLGYSEDYLADRPYIEAKFDAVLGHIERYIAPGRLLDVGAGPGFLVAVAERRGWKASGIDLNPWAAEYARTELGVDVRAADLTGDVFDGETFDAVTLMDVVEHVPDPDGLLATVAGIVRPGGVVALLTPDAGSPVSKVLGRRWPEVHKSGEHMVLFSRRGLTATLARHGLAALSWHSVGKTAPLATLVADVAPALPGVVEKVRAALAERPVGQRVMEFDPHTKFVLYARRLPDRARPSRTRPARVRKQPKASTDEAILDELHGLALAERYCDWLYSTFSEYVPGADVLEIGAGIGTFSRRFLDAGARSLVAVEPEPTAAGVLEATFEHDERVRVVPAGLPDTDELDDFVGRIDLAVCQNVLEHIADDSAALALIARTLRPGGRLALFVPARSGLFGSLDDAYGHWRRYDADELRTLLDGAGFELDSMTPMNITGIVGWWVSNKVAAPGQFAGSIPAFEKVVPIVRAVEHSVSPPVGLSLSCIARRRAG